MAKRGLMYFFTLSLGVGFISYLIISDIRKPRNMDTEKIIMDIEKKSKLLTQSELRLTGERVKNINIPESDEREGYM